MSTSWKVLPIVCPSDLHTYNAEYRFHVAFKNFYIFRVLHWTECTLRTEGRGSLLQGSRPTKASSWGWRMLSSHFCCHVEMVGNYCWWKDIYLTWYQCHHAFIVWEPIPSGCLWLVATCLHPECPCSKRSWADIGSEVKMPSMTICLFEEMVSSRLFNADGLPILIGAKGVLLLLGQASHESP